MVDGNGTHFPRGFDTPRRLAAGLAGGVWLCLAPFPALAAPFVVGGETPPGNEKQAARAVQSAFPEEGGDAELPLRLAQVLVPVPKPGAQPRRPGDAEELFLLLQPSRGLKQPGAAPQAPAPVPAPAVTAPGPAPTVAQTPAAAPAKAGEEEEEEGSREWTIPPIRWGGASGYSLQRSSSSSGASSLSHGMFSTFNAASYIYAPWLATVSGRLGLTTTSNSSSGGDGQGSQNRTSTVVGGGELNLAPSSRFPFQAFFDRSDSRASGNLVSNDYVNTRFGLRQTYRGEDGFSNAGLQFDHSKVDSSSGSSDTVTALSGNYATEIGIVRNSVSGRYSLGERSGTGERARLLGFNTAHNANLEDNLSLAGNVSYADNQLRGGSLATTFGGSRARFLQLNGFATWMPEFEERDDLPLTLTGGLRFSTLSNEFGSQRTDSRSMGANGNALYRFTNNLSVGASAAVNQVATQGTRSILLTLLGANVNYVGDPLNFGNFSYNWNTGANANWQSASGEIPANHFVGLQAGHSLGRFLPLSDTGTLSLSLSQNVAANQSPGIGSSTSLSHSASVGYSLRAGEQFTGNVTGSLSDILTTGVNAIHYRQLSVVFNGLGQLTPLSSANVNLQFNWTDQTVNQTAGLGQTPDTQHMTLLGSASYTHSRFLGLRGLRYTLLFTADTRLRDERLLGNVNGDVERTRWTLNNRLDYRIGLLDFRFNAALNDVGGKKNALLFFQVTRQIGAY